MSARNEVLGAVRRALDASGVPSPGAAPRAYRVEGAVAAGSVEAVDRFVDRLEDYRATVVRTTVAGLAEAVAATLTDVASVVVPSGLDPSWLRAARAAGVDVQVDDPSAPRTHAELDAVAAVLTGSRVAIAETGTIVLDAQPDQGRRALTLLPDRHVCVVAASQVVGSVPEAVRLLARHPDRPLTWISGPSATSDIELVRVEGVHGPRDLRVLVVQDA
ncbi:MAG TPA: lactate utilization protein C [Cellulomonas sp.]|uniref:LutC/YkgG family protein n=1 Tax=Cellulomonas sp. TaxID=40001 RepID=UPI002E2F5B38|nr:lactate utilization protein C [Cellulomonas sp.]HEX5332264.1 lactate utilization protein C [Cellulomonas sp.]